MNAKRFSALLLVAIVLSADTFLPVAGRHHRGNHGIELLLAAGILAKLLHKKGGHHHHHHGHHGHHHHGSGSRNVETMHAPPAMGGYDGAATSYSSSVDYPHLTAASHAYPVPPMPYMGFEPQPMAYGPPAVPHH